MREGAMMRKQGLSVALAGLMALICDAAFGAQPPFPDLTYAGAADGIARVPPDVQGFGVSARAAVPLRDGRLWLAGSAIGDGGGGTVRLPQPAFALLTAAGTADTTFGPNHDGLLILGPVDSDIANVVLTSGAKLVYVGLSEATGPTAMIGRITDAGVPDPSFDGDGQRFIGGNAFLAGGTEAVFQGVVLQPDGKILAVGAAASVQQGTPTICAAIMRFNGEDGSSDASFGDGTGHVCIAPENGGAARLSEAGSIALLADGRILAAGTSFHAGSSGFDFSVARLTANGEIDATFGPAHDGWAFVAFDEGGTLTDAANTIAIDAEGRIVLVGDVDASSGQRMGAARLLPEGQPDTTFGAQGRLEITALVGVQDLHLMPDGHILIGGRSATPGDFRGIAAMLRPDGQLEPRFGQGGLFPQTDGVNPPDYFSSAQRVVAGDYIYWIGGTTDLDGSIAAARAVLPLFIDSFETVPAP
jgi:uncharacterized delta-60 repeat protein